MTTQQIQVEPTRTAGSERHFGFAVRPDAPNAPYQAIISHSALAAEDVRSPKVFQETFERLAAQWRDETGMSSSISRKVRHSAYQDIIDMDWPVVPLILLDLQKGPDHWFVALKTITGADPVSDIVGVTSQAVTFQDAVVAWIDWGRSLGLFKT